MKPYILMKYALRSDEGKMFTTELTDNELREVEKRHLKEIFSFLENSGLSQESINRFSDLLNNLLTDCKTIGFETGVDLTMNVMGYDSIFRLEPESFKDRL